jgi:hypothetical protein
VHSTRLGIHHSIPYALSGGVEGRGRRTALVGIRHIQIFPQSLFGRHGSNTRRFEFIDATSI